MTTDDGVSGVMRAWDGFCEKLRQTGHDILKVHAFGPVETAQGAAEALQHLTQSLRSALDYRLDGFDPRHARMHWWDREAAAAIPGNPNIDSSYLIARIAPDETYRLTIRGGHFEECMISVHTAVAEDGSHRKSGDLTRADLNRTDDGGWTIILGGEKAEGARLELPADVGWIFIRIFYFDWAKGHPPEVDLENLSATDAAPNVIPVDHLIQGLDDAANWARATVINPGRFNTRFYGRSPGPNQLSVPGGETAGPASFFYGGCKFDLAPDEALLIEFEPPKARYWSVQWHRYPWGNSANFLEHITSLNHLQTHVDGDGKARVVFAHRDPGIQNWISTEGRREGLVYYRWFFTDDRPVPTSRVVKFDAIRSEIAADTPAFSAEERRAQMAERRSHLLRRY